MKKIIILFILPLAILMATTFTMTKEGLFPETQTTPTDAETQTIEAIEVSNHAPTASDVFIEGVASTGGKLTLNYNFSDIDGDAEGQSTIAWSTPTKELQNGTNKSFTIPPGYEGEEIGAWIKPQDIHGLSSSNVFAASNNYVTINNDKTTTTLPVAEPVVVSTPEPIPAPTLETTKNTSKYLEEVNLPKCDASNPEVQFIRSNDDWKTINSSSKRIFCVSPGDYKSLENISITASGTGEKRRYIILNNGNDLHPGQLDKSQIAIYFFKVFKCRLLDT